MGVEKGGIVVEVWVGEEDEGGERGGGRVFGDEEWGVEKGGEVFAG